MPAPRRPKRTRNQSRRSDQPAEGERLQKVLAAAGLGSRRKCEELIVQGRIAVDRKVVTELGTRVNPLTQEIKVDGEVLRKPRAVYFVVNKPPGVLSTNYDQDYRVRVIDLVKSSERLFTVGRLDQYSEGLILVTNDGELANRLTHPRYGATKTYHVTVAGAVEQTTLDRLERGVHLSEGVARVASLRVKKHHPQSTDLEMVLEEGKNREIRRVFAAVGHKVLRLRRVQIGPIKLGELPVGAHRPLGKEELEKLQTYAYAPRKKEEKPKRRPAIARSQRGPQREYDDEPLIDESDEALSAHGPLGSTGPVLIDDDLVNFDAGVTDTRELRPRRPGAVIAFEDDENVPAPTPEPATKPAPGKFSKKGRREQEQRGKKKFAKRAPRGEVRGETVRGDKTRGAKPRGNQARAEKPRGFGPPKKFAKKQARRKGRS